MLGQSEGIRDEITANDLNSPTSQKLNNSISNNVAIGVEHISKKFSKSLTKSMVYGLIDIGHNILRMRTCSHKLRKDEFWAVDDVSFELCWGETLGIIGPNGSGKSTMLKMINGIYWPDKGKMTIRGKVGALIEIGAGFHPLLTGRENIYLYSSILGRSKKEVEDSLEDIIAFADIGDFIDAPMKFYSSGMFVRLGFAVAVHCEPDILLVDEVLAVGDADFRAKSARKMRELIGGDKTLVFISHNMQLVSSICEKVLVLDKGKCVYLGPTDEGIMRYEKSFLDKQLLKQHSIGPEVQTFVKIRSIELLDDSGNQVTEIGTDDSLTINVVVESNSQIENPIIGVRLWRQDGISCWNEKTSYHNIKTGIIDGKYSFKLIIEKIQLSSSYYYFQINIFDSASTTLVTKYSSYFYVKSNIPLLVDRGDFYHPLIKWGM